MLSRQAQQKGGRDFARLDRWTVSVPDELYHSSRLLILFIAPASVGICANF